MRVLNIVSHSEEQTEALAVKLAGSFKTGDVIILSGSLGAGKTTFVRALAKGLGLDPEQVNSPSYTIVNEYKGKPSLYHFDLYRLGDLTELKEIGWDEYLLRKGIVVVEWGEKASDALPESYYQIEMVMLSENEREINISLIQP